MYVDCNVEQLMYVLTNLFSEEGMAELTGRVAAAFPFEIAECQKVRMNPDDYTQQEKGTKYGQCAVIVLDWTL